MLDIGWQELFIIAIFAILVIGPKDLPRALKTVTQWVRKARGLAREFQSGVDEMVREAELDDVKTGLKKLSHGGGLKKTIADSIDPTGELNYIQNDLDKTAREAVRDKTPAAAEATGEQAAEEENPFKNKSGNELRALIEERKQKEAMAEAAGEAARVEAEAGLYTDAPPDLVGGPGLVDGPDEGAVDATPEKPGA